MYDYSITVKFSSDTPMSADDLVALADACAVQVQEPVIGLDESGNEIAPAAAVEFEEVSYRDYTLRVDRIVSGGAPF